MAGSRARAEEVEVGASKTLVIASEKIELEREAITFSNFYDIFYCFVRFLNFKAFYFAALPSVLGGIGRGKLKTCEK